MIIQEILLKIQDEKLANHYCEILKHNDIKVFIVENILETSSGEVNFNYDLIVQADKFKEAAAIIAKVKPQANFADEQALKEIKKEANTVAVSNKSVTIFLIGLIAVLALIVYFLLF